MAYVRNHRFTAGRPVAFDPEDPQVSAVEYLLAALGSDLLDGLRSAARRAGLDLHEVEATVSGGLGNPLLHLDVVGEEGDPGLTWVRVRVYAGGGATEAQLSGLLQAAAARSPIAATLGRAAAMDLSITTAG